MKHTIYSILCIGIYAVIAGAAVSTTSAFNTPAENIVAAASSIKHDWECNHIIHDFYHEHITEHYVDSYEPLVNGGVRFTSHDGNTYEIPYPYFSVEDNK